MDKNSTAQYSSFGTKFVFRHATEKMMIVQLLLGIFLYVNFLMIFTFFKKEAFRNNTRYILFAHALLCDTLFLILSNIFLQLDFTHTIIPVWLCIIIYSFVKLLVLATPLTLTAMCLERYVAICMPLRHAEITSPRRAFCCIIIIHALSSVQQFTVVFMVVSAAPPGFYTSFLQCRGWEGLLVIKWQHYIRSVIFLLYFSVMSATIGFTYIKIMGAAKVASSDNKKSSSKGLRTVALHTFQLLLVLFMFLMALPEMALQENNFQAFLELRYFNYITFTLSPRCLSPLVYGLRDEKFVLVLKYYACFGFYRRISPVNISLD